MNAPAGIVLLSVKGKLPRTSSTACLNPKQHFREMRPPGFEPGSPAHFAFQLGRPGY